MDAQELKAKRTSEVYTIETWHYQTKVVADVVRNTIGILFTSLPSEEGQIVWSCRGVYDAERLVLLLQSAITRLKENQK